MAALPQELLAQGFFGRPLVLFPVPYDTKVTKLLNGHSITNARLVLASLTALS